MEIEDFVEKVIKTLEYWHSVHTDREAWFDWQFGNYIADDLVGHLEMRGHDFTHHVIAFNWREDAIKNHETFRDWHFDYSRCSLCGEIIDNTSQDDHVSDNHYDDEGVDDMDWDGVDVDEPDVLEYLKDVAIDTGFIPSENALRQSLLNTGYDLWYNYFGPNLDSVVYDIEDSLSDYHLAENRHEEWTIIMRMLQIAHLGGNLLEDYGDVADLDSDLIYDVREYGAADMFGEDEFIEWLNGD